MTKFNEKKIGAYFKLSSIEMRISNGLFVLNTKRVRRSVINLSGKLGVVDLVYFIGRRTPSNGYGVVLVLDIFKSIKPPSSLVVVAFLIKISTNVNKPNGQQCAAIIQKSVGPQLPYFLVDFFFIRRFPFVIHIYRRELSLSLFQFS